MQTLTKEKIVFEFNKNNKFNYSVQNNEIFYVETEDCYNGQIKNENTKRKDIDMSIVDCSVGPIEVIGSKAGDILEVEVIDIELAEQGVMTTAPNLGVLGDKILILILKL